MTNSRAYETYSRQSVVKVYIHFILFTEDVGATGTLFSATTANVIVNHGIKIHYCSKPMCAAFCVKYDECATFALYADEGDKCWCQMLQPDGGGTERTDIYTKN